MKTIEFSYIFGKIRQLGTAWAVYKHVEIEIQHALRESSVWFHKLEPCASFETRWYCCQKLVWKLEERRRFDLFPNRSRVIGIVIRYTEHLTTVYKRDEIEIQDNCEKSR